MSDPFPSVGTIVTFDVTSESIGLGIPSQQPQGAKLTRYAGIVTGNQPMTPYGESKIPTRAVAIRGRTNKSVTVDGVAVDLKAWPSWAEADRACKAFNHP